MATAECRPLTRFEVRGRSFWQWCTRAHQHGWALTTWRGALQPKHAPVRFWRLPRQTQVWPSRDESVQ
jgi:hypothetical protein